MVAEEGVYLGIEKKTKNCLKVDRGLTFERGLTIKILPYVSCVHGHIKMHVLSVMGVVLRWPIIYVKDRALKVGCSPWCVSKKT